MIYVAENCNRNKSFLLIILEDGRYPSYYQPFVKTLEGQVEELILLINGGLKKQGKKIDENGIVFVSSALFGSLLHVAKEKDFEEIHQYCQSITGYIFSSLDLHTDMHG